MPDLLARRDFLKSAGLLTVGFSLGRIALGEPGTPQAGQYGPPEDALDSWIAIDSDGIATLYTGICEVGTGSHTAILQIMAEELDVAFEHTRLVGPDTDRTPDQFVSSGSRSIAGHAIPIRQAAAEARHALLVRAAALLVLPREQLEVKDGIVSVVGDPTRRVSYGQLIGGRRFDLKVTGAIKPKPPSQYGVVGTSVRRIDLPGKITGTFTFMQDVKVTGMLHGRVIRPPSHGATVLAIDEASVAELSGLVKVVRKADLVGVVCEREEQAIAAARKLKVSWSGWAGLPDKKQLYQTLRSTPIYSEGVPARFPGGILAKQGDLKAAFAGAKRTAAATYETPFHLHGSIGPSCAVADVTPERVTVWSGTQTPYGLRDAVAKFLGLDASKVRVIFAEAAGCYGQNGADDVVIDAVVMSQAVGRPVRVQWMRPDETGWETYKTARVTDMRAGLDAAGNIVAWESAAWGFSGYSRPEYHEPRHGGEPGSLVTARLAGWTKLGFEEGFNGVTLEAIPPYEILNKHVVFNYLGPTSHREGPIRLRTGSMRGVGAPDNLFAVESFMDELAAAVGADPVEFRERHLKDERAHVVLRAATERAGWRPRNGHPQHGHPGQKGAVRSGQGVALWAGKDSTHVASTFDVEVDTNTGKVFVKRVVVAIDCGLMVNPDGIRNQVEGGVIQSISRALMEEVTFDRSRVTSLDWASYPIIRFDDVPEEVEVLLINRPDLPAYGVGEAGTKNVWAGVANAIFDATGVRLRRMPFTPENVKRALLEHESAFRLKYKRPVEGT
jgi:nicotinate dehydrogenase subunit B